MSDVSSSRPLITPNAVSTRRISDADAAVVDAILEARSRGGAPAHLPPQSAQRAARVMALLDLLEADPVEAAPSDLTQRTLDRVRQFRHQQRFAAQVQMLTEERPGGFGFGLGQFMSVGAIFVLAAALLFPVLDHSRATSRQIVCANNLRDAGQAFHTYAVANAGVLPRLPAKPGSSWWEVGQLNDADDDAPVTSNSAHLYVLVRDNPLTANALYCPENGHARPEQLSRQLRDWPKPQAVSFSYQNQYTSRPIRLQDNPHLALLADRNPLFVVRREANRIAFARGTSAEAPSRSHGSRGQNILTADGAVQWTIRPVVTRPGAGGDNVWTVPGVREYQGKETPVVGEAGAIDAFLVP